VLGAGEPVGGVGPLAMIGDGLETGADVGNESLIGVGAGKAIAAETPSAVFFMADIFAEISARFCAMRAAPDNCLSPPFISAD
jgi:hypothetical protein